MFAEINDRYFVLGRVGFSIFKTILFTNQSPDAIQIQGRAMKLVHGFVEVPHTDFAEIPRMAVKN